MSISDDLCKAPDDNGNGESNGQAFSKANTGTEDSDWAGWDRILNILGTAVPKPCRSRSFITAPSDAAAGKSVKPDEHQGPNLTESFLNGKAQ